MKSKKEIEQEKIDNLEELAPEHVPVIPLDAEIEKKKEENRKLIAELRKNSPKQEAIVITADGQVKKVSELTISEQDHEIIRCATDPIYYIETYLTIFDQTQGKNGKIVPFKLFDFQKKIIRALQKNQFNIINKYRQGGCSTLIAGYVSWYVSFVPNRTAAIVADKLTTARDEVMYDVIEFIKSCPEWLVPKTGKESEKSLKDTQILKRYDNGSSIGAFSSKGLRGLTPSLLAWDEVSWTENSNKFWTSAYPTLQTGGAAVMISCVTKDTYIFTNKGIKQIKDFIPNENLGAHIINEYSILGKDKLRSGNIFFNNGFVNTLKVKTTFTELESSYNHKYWTYKKSEDKYGIYKASELEIGDYVSIQYGMNIWGNNDDCSDFKPTISNSYSPNNITPNIAYFIGLYICQGYVRNISIACRDSLKCVFDEIGFKYCIDPFDYKKSLKSMEEFLEYLGFDLTKKQKVIPPRLFEMSKENIIALIQGIMDGNGSTTYNKKRNRIGVEIGLSSKILIEQLRILFGNFGILTNYYEYIAKPTKLVKTSIRIYRIAAYNSNAMKYFNEIGFRFKRKQNNKFLFNVNKQTNGNDLLWTPIKSIEKSQNWTYDFSLPNDNPEENNFHHSVIYNQFLGYQTPNGLDETFYKTFIGAKHKENDFNAIELWWYNDPRYNKDLVWLKNKGKTNEIKLIDENWTEEHRLKLKEDGWEASSPWFEAQIRNANGDMRRIAQELLCISSDSLLTIYNIFTKKYETVKISDLYDRLIKIHESYLDAVINDRYLIYTSSNEYVRFLGVSKSHKNTALKITLENNMSITVSEDHIFLANGVDMYAKSLVPNIAYITTTEGDFYVKSVEKIDGCDFYDIVDSEGCEYFANGFLNHNCSFLGSGNNFIAEEFLKSIEENDVQEPLRQEYVDGNMWIWEDPQIEEEYIMAIDASAGHGEDNSTINILKTTEIIEEKVIIKNEKAKKVKIKTHRVEQVAEYYGKVTPQMLSEIAYQFGKSYNNAYCIIDITGGYGVQTIEKLLEFGYDNIHYAEVVHKPSRDRLAGYVKKGQKIMPDGNIITVDLIPGFFIGNNRASVLLELQRTINLKEVTIRSTRLLNELKTFITVAGNRVADHKRSFHDDSIMGLAIGLFTLNYEMAKFKQNKGVAEKMINAFLTANDIREIDKKQERIENSKLLSNNPSTLNPYAANSWLFKGLDKKK